MKKHLKLLFKTLISNNACVEAGRTKTTPYSIIAICFAVLALFLSVLPMTVNAFKKNGSDWMNSTLTYNLDNGFYELTNECKQNGISFKIQKEEGKNSNILTISDDINNPKVFKVRDETYQQENEFENYDKVPLFVSVSRLGGADGTRVRTFEAYDFTNEDDDKEFLRKSTCILNNLNPFVGDQGNDKDESRFLRWSWVENKDGTTTKTKLSRYTSCVFFGKRNIYAYSFQPGGGGQSSIGGDYNSSSRDVDLINKFYVENKPIDTYNNWKPFFNEIYVISRNSAAWRATGIMVGVNAGVLLFMGLLIFILTRGKNNPFRIYSFWDCQKIAYFSCLSAGILSLFGFLISGLAMMMFVLIIGIRVMWLSMRTLRSTPAPGK